MERNNWATGLLLFVRLYTVVNTGGSILMQLVAKVLTSLALLLVPSMGIAVLGIVPSTVHVVAQSDNPENPRQADGTEANIQAEGNKCRPGSGGLPLPTWYQYLPGQKVNGQCEIKTDGLGGTVIILILMGIFDILLYVAGVIAVVMIIWGGFKLLTSDGEPQKIAAARTTLFNALVGMVIAVIASQIVGFIAGGLA